MYTKVLVKTVEFTLQWGRKKLGWTFRYGPECHFTSYYQDQEKYPDTMRIKFVYCGDNLVAKIYEHHVWYLHECGNSFCRAEQLNDKVQEGYHHLTTLDDGIHEVQDEPFEDHYEKDNWIFFAVHEGRRIEVPIIRPFKAEWASVNKDVKRLSGVSEKNWGALLDSLEGRFYKDLPFVNVMDDERKLSIKDFESPKSTTKKPKGFGQCIKDDTFVQVQFGNQNGRLVFKSDKHGLYVVDGPEYGVGLYVFGNQTDAQDWALGITDVIEARSKASFFTPHDKKEMWVTRFTDYLYNKR